MENSPPTGLDVDRALVVKARPASIRRPGRSPVADPAADPEAIAVCRELVLRNHDMIWRLAGRYACRRAPADDLAQEGVIAICRAILRYDLDGPCRFIADFRGLENNQAFGSQSPRFFGEFFIPVPRSLIIFPAQAGSVGYVSAFVEP